MELENGKIYRIQNAAGTTDIRVLEQNAYAYLVEVINTSVPRHKATGKKAFLEKESNWIKDIVGEVDPNEIDYTPELIDLLIEAALIAKDKELFLEMTNKKKGMTQTC